MFYNTNSFCSLADYIAAANHRLDGPKEQTPAPLQDSSVISQTSGNQLSAAQASQFSSNPNHNPTAEALMAQNVVPVDTSEVDALLEKFKSEVEVCQKACTCLSTWCHHYIYTCMSVQLSKWIYHEPQ